MPESGAPKPHFRTIALIVGAAIFMEQLDGTVLATALPSMARELGVSAPSLSIALTSYLISLAVFIPVSGRIADRFGARTVFRSAIVIFLLGSIACANAPSVGFLVVARFFEGVGGALMMPVGRLVLMRGGGTDPGPADRGFHHHLFSFLALDLLHQCAYRPDRHRAGQPVHLQYARRSAGENRL